MKYKICTAVFLLTSFILAAFLINDKILLRKAVLETYNQWSSDITSTQSLLQSSADSPTNSDPMAIQAAYDAFNIASGRISNAITYPIPAKDTNGMLANLDFEINNEFDALLNNGQPTKDRAFLADQLSLVVKQLPKKLTTVHQLSKLSDQLELLTSELHKKFAIYIAKS